MVLHVRRRPRYDSKPKLAFISRYDRQRGMCAAHFWLMVVVPFVLPAEYRILPLCDLTKVWLRRPG